jgi:lipoprotein-anchoring transpeptidase ErfK/SrfK
MTISKRTDALSGSFMFMSFVTAALLIGVQSREMFANSATPPANSPQETAQLEATQLEATPNPPSADVGQISTANAPQTAPLQPGIADLSAGLNPVVLVRQPRLVVDLSERQVSLYQDGVWQASFDIAVGREGWETPTGEFQILSMQEQPVWQNPMTGETVSEGAGNPLGSRWIGFWTDGTHQIGFHGTDQEDLIGQAVSHGCIRMRDPEIQTLFTQVGIGTPVVVEP